MSQLRLLLFGRFQVTRNDAPITNFQTNKTKALLAYLALKPGQPHTRAALAGILWPEKPEQAALANLRQSLRHLRLTIGEDVAETSLLISRQTVQFNPAGAVWIDVFQFTQHLAAVKVHSHPHLRPCPDCIQQLEQAATLYRDDLLADSSLHVSPAFDELIISQRAALLREVTEALEQLTAYYQAQQLYEQMLHWTQRWLAIDPWCEQAHGQLIQGLALTGQRTAAFEHYERYVRLMADEFGLEPAPEIAGLVNQIRADNLQLGEEHQTPVQPHSSVSLPSGTLSRQGYLLPAPLTSFIGRQREISNILAMLNNPNIRLITLTGAGGSGKTRLAVEAATRLAASFVHGVCFVPLASIVDSTFVAPAIAQALGLQEDASETIIKILKVYLHDKTLLLVLDNMEHLLDAAPLISELLDTAPQLKVLVTSRTLLHLYGEHELIVHPLEVPPLQQPGAIAALAGYPSIALFIDRARAVRPDLPLTQENIAAIAEICARLDGLPLAIELAAAQCKLRSVPTLLALLRSPLAALTGGARDLPARQQTLRNTIDWSYQLLRPDEQRLFVRLAVFRSSATCAAIEAICDNLGSERPTQAVLESLVNHSMVQYTIDDSDEPRFFLLETIREYALEQLRAQGSLEPLRQRHLAYYRDLIEQVARPYIGVPAIAPLMALERERDNLRTALEWALESGELESGLCLAGGLWPFWYTSGAWSEGYSWLRQLWEATNGRLPALRAALGYRIAFLAWSMGLYQEAVAYAEEGLACCREDRTDVSAVLSRASLGLGVLYQGDLARAKDIIQEALAISRELGDPGVSANTLIALGHVAWYAGDVAWARAIHEESLALARSLGDLLLIGFALTGLERVSLQQAQFEQVRSYCQESRAIFEALGDRRGVAKALTHEGLAAYHQGQYDQAVEAYTQSLALYKELGDKRGIATVLTELGLAVLQQHNLALACRLQEESLALARELHDQRRICISLANQAFTASQQGEWAPAGSLYGESLRILRALSDLGQLAITLEYIAAHAAGTGHYPTAVTLFGAAQAIRERIDAPQSVTTRIILTPVLADISRSLDDITAMLAWHNGWKLSAPEAIDLALKYLRGADTFIPGVAQQSRTIETLNKDQ